MSGKDKEQTKTKNNSAPKVTKTSKTDIDKAKDSSQVAPASIDNQPIHTAGGGTVQKVSLDELKKKLKLRRLKKKSIMFLKLIKHKMVLGKILILKILSKQM